MTLCFFITLTPKRPVIPQQLGYPRSAQRMRACRAIEVLGRMVQPFQGWVLFVGDAPRVARSSQPLG